MTAGELTFEMGTHVARFPADRRYSRNHLWLKGDGATDRVGFTGYSIRLLKDIYFLDWTVDPHGPVAAGATLGEIESSKALSSLHPPSAGTLGRFNDGVLSDPAAINAEPYGDGWLYEFAPADGATFLSAAEYVTHLTGVWETTQKVLKKQVNA